MPPDEHCTDLRTRVAVLETKLSNLDRVMDLRFAENVVALKLASTEVQRRLDLLNGEAERLAKMQATYLPRREYELSQERIADNIAQTRRATLVAIVSAIGSILLLAANWLLRIKP